MGHSGDVAKDIGPVEILEIVFPGNRFTGEIAPGLGELVESGSSG